MENSAPSLKIFRTKFSTSALYNGRNKNRASKLHITQDTTQNSNNSLISGGAMSSKNESSHLVSIWNFFPVFNFLSISKYFNFKILLICLGQIGGLHRK